jgi:plastocyanin
MRKSSCLWVLAMGMAAAFAAPAEPPAPAAPQAPAPEVKPATPNVGGVKAQGTGTVTGIVRFKGEKPEAKPIAEVAGNGYCKQCYPDALPRHDDFVFGKNGADDTLVNVLVYVSKGLEDKTFDVPREPVLLDQSGCMYAPHVVAVMVGQTLEIRNSDATLHNVMSTPRNNAPFNFGMPGKDQVIKKVFKQPELKMNLRCFMHPWMSSYVHVLEHPFFAVTQADGTFTIQGLPPGEYEISVLHEAARFEATPTTVAVTVGAGETRTIEFGYRQREAKK